MNSETNSRIGGAVLGSFVGDALALGAHWIYNPSKIARLYGRITEFVNPADNQYHSARQTGEFTHYGDQALRLMRSLEPDRDFSLDGFKERWTAMWPNYPGYVDGATRETLESGSSTSNDLAGASRIAPLLAGLSRKDESTLVAAAKAQTAFSHGDPGVIEVAQFFAVLARRLVDGVEFTSALQAAAGLAYEHIDPIAAIERCQADLDMDTIAAMEARGLDCHLPNAFPATLYIILKHEHSLEDALIANTMAGGDSAARGMLIGLVLGAKLGEDAIPARWLSGMLGSEEIVAWLASHFGRPGIELQPGTNKFEFDNGRGQILAARLEWPTDGSREPRGIAIFAHCFTCSKDLPATTRISRSLADEGFAVLRFDFTGLGSSDGDFANENFSSNVQDLVAAAQHLEKAVGQPPNLLIGHSLGGAAVLAAASQIPSIRGMVTIGAPSDPGHVSHLFESDLESIEADGEAEVSLAGAKIPNSATIRRRHPRTERSQKLRHFSW